MTKGMKKFTKGCLVTALVLFIAGCVMCSVGGLLGGFRVLDGMDVRQYTGFPFRFITGTDGWMFGFFDDATEEDTVNWDDSDWMPIGGTSAMTVTELTADTLRGLEIEAGACELYIQASEDECVRLAADSVSDRVRYRIEDGVLRLKSKQNWRSNMGISRKADRVYLYFPAGTRLDRADIEFGAGILKSVELTAKEIDIEVGAGECHFDGLYADGTVRLETGAGKLYAGKLSCNTVDLSAGAGEVVIDDALVANGAGIEIGMGSIEFTGTVMGNLDAECSMGNIRLSLGGAETDHNYTIDCALGTVRIGGSSYTGLAHERNIDNASASNYTIDCSMGTVAVDFER